MEPKVWLITGCSSGIGRGIAKAALAAGDIVAMTARDPGKLEELSQAYPQTSCALQLEVTDAVEAERVVGEVLSRYGRIDVLVNNAGYGYRAAVEESEDEETRKLFEVNVFAPLRLAKLVLPSMCQRRQGLIVNVTSIGGVRGAVGNGMYSASKGAMELASDTLRKECEPLGIRVLTVEPGAFRTSFYDNLRGTAADINDYADTAGRWHVDKVDHAANQPGDPEKAGQVIVRLAGMSRLPGRIALGSDAVRVVEDEYTARLAELHEWADLSRQTDF